ncbi:MAG: Asp-tRNA(Asn)/Glu-tRNA(Gln) amidotransferase subunit GatA [Zoogloea oleivorans]|jgi:aspartyl-tRNA(Asn)/glutamyl-tRNA(Gln) amidotransferase subunit A|uniref:Asp-tRNA(Asn)/Glu-tRNA(Gln) amidotransferase subunit GatA n=1 Tax=Zoogloea oleivorans TaxID=1552750 RepID=UPI002A35B724|nr:Asp-tRNA(Asn)/Glu-tRNA(Gln) amidotransferase subunit GatA [Zoogloea oleivorans]MDY0037934.1 Asp-tRNA(Asn)/Glu-tRNA(Gln) amidotransferase subunit GatA [Zoogloea oleivorans]
MIDSSLKEIAAALRAKTVSAVELATESLARIEAGNPKINAFVTVDRDGALAAAKAADARLAASHGGPLTGIPLAHKDVFCTEGVLTTCGSKMLSNFVSPYDAHVVTLLKAAGAVMVGKTNMDEFAMGSSNENSHFGPTRNPWNTDKVPGGSSGGSAAAVAARMVPIATGTDTGGSIRQPASLCGITGIKPTYGTVSRYGMIAYASSLDQGGAFGRSAEDCALMLSAMNGHDPRDSTSLERDTEDYTADLARPLAGLRIGLPTEFFADGMSDDVRAAVEAALAEYRKLGAVTVDVSLPNARLAIPAYYVIAPAEASSNLSRFDGVRYGHRAAEYGDLNDMYCKSRAQGFGAEVKRRILVGTYVLSHGYYDAYYIKAQKLRRLIAQDFAAAFAQCDVIAGPTCPTVAFGIGEKSNDPVQMYLGDIYTVAVNLAGLPALAHPAGFGAGGMPVGLQLIGNYFGEARLLGVAHQFQQNTDWHARKPAV